MRIVGQFVLLVWKPTFDSDTWCWAVSADSRWELFANGTNENFDRARLACEDSLRGVVASALGKLGSKALSEYESVRRQRDQAVRVLRDVHRALGLGTDTRPPRVFTREYPGKIEELREEVERLRAIVEKQEGGGRAWQSES